MSSVHPSSNIDVKHKVGARSRELHLPRVICCYWRNKSNHRTIVIVSTRVLDVEIPIHLDPFSPICPPDSQSPPLLFALDTGSHSKPEILDPRRAFETTRPSLITRATIPVPGEDITSHTICTQRVFVDLFLPLFDCRLDWEDIYAWMRAQALELPTELAKEVCIQLMDGIHRLRRDPKNFGTDLNLTIGVQHGRKSRVFDEEVLIQMIHLLPNLIGQFGRPIQDSFKESPSLSLTLFVSSLHRLETQLIPAAGSLSILPRLRCWI